MTRWRGARRVLWLGIVCVAALSCADRSPPAAWPEPDPPSFAKPVVPPPDTAGDAAESTATPTPATMPQDTESVDATATGESRDEPLRG